MDQSPYEIGNLQGLKDEEVIERMAQNETNQLPSDIAWQNKDL